LFVPNFWQATPTMREQRRWSHGDDELSLAAKADEYEGKDEIELVK